MTIDLSKVAFIHTFKYMRKFNDYTIPPGGGSIAHNLGYEPFFLASAQKSGYGFTIPIRTGGVVLPGADSAFYIINVTSTSITIIEDLAPAAPTTYFLRVYEDPLP